MNTMKISDLQILGREALSLRIGLQLAALETDLLLSEILGESRLYLALNPQKTIQSRWKDEFCVKLGMRKEGWPMAYLLEHKEFMGYDFIVRGGVLIPRDDTEVVIELVNNALKGISGTIQGAEIGVGTGIISLTLLSKYKQLHMIGGDINPLAISISKENALYLDQQHFEDGADFKISERLTLVDSDIFASMGISDNTLGFIVSNPPYIPDEVIPTLEVDVRDFEPLEALDGGADGLDFYRKILEEGLSKLKRGGFVAFEIGHDQGPAMQALMQAYGLSKIQIQKDLAKHDRGIIGFKEP